MNNTKLVLVILLSLTGCSLENLVEVDDPESGKALNQEFVHSREGVIGLFHTSLANLKFAVNHISRDVGIFTDEMTVFAPPNQPVVLWTLIEGRRGEGMGATHRGVVVGWYATLQKARVTAAQSIQLTKKLGDSTLNFIIAGAYAIEGYSILLLAENFCSGVPLTSVSIDGKLVYGSPVSTEDMFNKAISLFDSALTIGHDSSHYITLAKIGKARAYLGLGDYNRAYNFVSDINQLDKFGFTFTAQATPGSTSPAPSDRQPNLFWAGRTIGGNNDYNESQIINRDGINGLIWFDDPRNIDPRLPVTTTVVAGVVQFPAIVRQKKFSGTSIFYLAHGIEAKMIEAEYYLSIDDPRWLEVLNEMRRKIGLSDTTDPGIGDGRTDLLFRERAFWLYLEGHRLADMRRLVRQYGRSPYEVYPIGRYERQPASEAMDIYGDEYLFVPNADEIKYNFNYDGCINRNP